MRSIINLQFVLVVVVLSFVCQTGLSSSSGEANLYILDRPVDLLPGPYAFNKQFRVRPGRSTQPVVFQKVPNKNPRRWRAFAVKVVSPPRSRLHGKVYYISKKYFRRGTSETEKSIGELLMPGPVMGVVERTLRGPTAREDMTCPSCPAGSSPPVVPGLKAVFDIVAKSKSYRECGERLLYYYKNNSSWANFSRDQRIGKLSDLVDEVLRTVKNRGTVPHYVSKKRNNPKIIDSRITKDVMMCLFRQETSISSYDPHTLNYTYCYQGSRNCAKNNSSPDDIISCIQRYRGAKGRRLSTAFGIGQMTFTTFNRLRRSGVMPFVANPGISDSASGIEVFQKMFDNPKMQVEATFNLLNYLLKNLAKKRSSSSTVYNAVKSYDGDLTNKFMIGYQKCMRCAKRKKIEECIK